MRKQKRQSIKLQLAVVVIGLVIGTIFACWLVNSCFLETYYINHKQNSLIDVYEKLNQAYDEGYFNDESFDIELQKVCGKSNINMLILDEESKTFKATMNDPDFLKHRLLEDFFKEEQNGETDQNRIIIETEQYMLRRIEDPTIHTEYIEMLGFLKNGNLFFLRTPIEGIRDSVFLANRFLGYVGIVAVLVSGIVIWFVSKKVTEPVSELAKISNCMKNLDFDTKYTGTSRNEIGALGENINELSESLEKMISELKTANLELQKDVEKKTAIDEMRKEFLSNVSHELKTPIALIQGYAEGLKEGISEDPESRNYYCDVIVDESQKMNNMVQKLITLNKLEFGDGAVSMERFDVMDMVRTFVQSADLLLRQEGITCDVIGNSPCMVWADAFFVEEVFRNYFTNAMHYCDYEKRITVSISQSNGKTRIAVLNTGDPIPEDALSHVWEKFYKVDKARTREYGGSGIGLSIVKAMMESMNGRYGVLNHENSVEFWIEL